MIDKRHRATSIIIAIAVASLMLGSSLTIVQAISNSSRSSRIFEENIVAHTPSKVETVDYTATWGYQPGHPGDLKYIYVQNGLIKFTFTNGYWGVASINGDAALKLGNLVVQTNNSLIIASSSMGTSQGYVRDFVDDIGRGIQFQMKVWPSLEVSFYWNIYDSESFVTMWFEIRNVLTYTAKVNLAICQFDPRTTGSGVIVDTTPNMWEWVSYQASGYRENLWTGNHTLSETGSQWGGATPVSVVTSDAIEKSITIGFATETVSYGVVKYDRLNIGDAGGIYAQMNFVDNLPPVQVHIAPSANQSTDIAFIGMQDSSDLRDCFDDYDDVVLALNDWFTEDTPVADGTLMYSGFPIYGYDCYPVDLLEPWVPPVPSDLHPMNDSIVRDIADFVSARFPNIKYIRIECPWEQNARSINCKDTLGMQVNSTEYPNMAQTVAYVHSKGLQVVLWVDPTNMYFTGIMNSSHPEWRLRYNDTLEYLTYNAIGHSWVADITHPGYLAYLTDQLTAMHTMWGIDGVSIDFESLAVSNRHYWDTNHTLCQMNYAYYEAIRAGTVGMTLVQELESYVNIFKGQSFNAIRMGPDSTTYLRFKDTMLNYTIGYLAIQGPAGSSFPLPDLDQISNKYFNTTDLPGWYTQTMTDCAEAVGGFVMVCFEPLENKTLFDMLKPILNNVAFCDTARFWNGQKAATHINAINFIGRENDWFCESGGPNATGALVNFGMVTAIVELDLEIFDPGPYVSVYDNSIAYQMSSAGSISYNLAVGHSKLLRFASGNAERILYSDAIIVSHSDSRIQYSGLDDNVCIVLHSTSEVYWDSGNTIYLTHTQYPTWSNLLTVRNADATGDLSSIGFLVASTSIVCSNVTELTSKNIKWISQASSSVVFTLSDLEIGRIWYNVYADGQRIEQLKANDTGQITFTYSGPWSDHTFEVVRYDPWGPIYDMGPWMLTLGFTVGISAIMITAVLSRARSGRG